MSISAVHGVSAGCECLTLLTSVGGRSGSLAVNYVGGNGENGGSGNTASVCVILSDMLHESVYDIVSDRVNAIIIVAVLGEVALNLVIGSNACLVSDNLNLSVLDRGE